MLSDVVDPSPKGTRGQPQRRFRLFRKFLNSTNNANNKSYNKTNGKLQNTFHTVVAFIMRCAFSCFSFKSGHVHQRKSESGKVRMRIYACVLCCRLYLSQEPPKIVVAATSSDKSGRADVHLKIHICWTYRLVGSSFAPLRENRTSPPGGESAAAHGAPKLPHAGPARQSRRSKRPLDDSRAVLGIDRGLGTGLDIAG